VSARAIAPVVAAPVAVLTPLQRPMLQRTCDCGEHTCGGECDDCKKKKMSLQRQAVGSAGPSIAPPIVHDVLRSPGQPLDEGTQTYFTSRFRHDFSLVRVHTDQRSAESARAVNAQAYTVGTDVVFGEYRYAPETSSGKHLLAHELTHVIQQRGARGSGPLMVNRPGDDCESEADQIASRLTSNAREPVGVGVQRSSGSQGLIQRFSTSEHEEIGRAAYQAAPPQSTSASTGPHPEPLDKELVKSLKDFRYKHAGGKESDYGQLVAMPDDVASFQLMEDQDRERAGSGFRVPVLSRIWDWIGDSTHYLDLASRNRDHFHPHNFMAWQAWHWAALASMDEAAKLEASADKLNVALNVLFKTFNERSQRVRTALEQRDQTGAKSDVLDKTISREVAVLSKQVEEMRKKQAKVAELRAQAKDLAIHAMAVNGFGDHFLTDAYAGGHIVTPRAELLDSYTTKFLGLIKVGGVLQCANIPSLAWHDLDNKFGVRVKNRSGQVWTTFGDNYLHHTAPKNEPTTYQQVVLATTRSVRHMWETAAGRKPTGLLDVLNLLPAPDLDPAIYPTWKPPDWLLQLRYAAGEPVGADYDDVLGRPSAAKKPPEEVPNPKGNQIGTGPLSARATCVNLLSVFSYDGFVVPMIQRVREEYKHKFFSGSGEQILPPTARPKPQASVVGHVAAGSLIGLLGGALLGFAVGGVVGAVIGGIVGLLGGGLVGGLIGGERKGSAVS
jgi:hypothetical protein